MVDQSGGQHKNFRKQLGVWHGMRIRPLKSSRRRAALENAARAAVEPLEGRLLLSTVTLSVTASGGNWSAFAADSTGDNAGIATFDFDVVGTGGVTVNTGHNKTPVGTDSQSDADGFDDLRQNGTVGTQSGIVVNGVSGTYQGDFGITGTRAASFTKAQTIQRWMLK